MRTLPLIVLCLLGCSSALEEPIAEEQLALPVQIGMPANAPCVLVSCDQANCSGTLTVTQTVPTGIGTVEVWDATQRAATAWYNWAPVTEVTQLPGTVVTETPMSNFRQNETFCLLTGVVVRNAAGNVVGSAPTANGQLTLLPSAVTAVVTP